MKRTTYTFIYYVERESAKQTKHKKNNVKENKKYQQNLRFTSIIKLLTKKKKKIERKVHNLVAFIVPSDFRVCLLGMYI